MKRIENKKKPWKAKKIALFKTVENQKVLTKKEPYDWKTGVGRGRRITGWDYCSRIKGYLQKKDLKAEINIPQRCYHCKVSAQTPIIGTTSWTKVQICPYMGHPSSWKKEGYDWRPWPQEPPTDPKTEE